MIPPIVNQFVAGETRVEAIEHARTLNERGVGAMINLLGWHHREREKVAETATAYQELVEELANSSVDASLTVKPTQLGLTLDEGLFRELATDVVETATGYDTFVWFDMEQHTTTDLTLDLFEELARENGGGLGVCVQASLKRTPADVDRLADVPGSVRFVKGGTYDEPVAVAYQNKATINRAYRAVLEYAFKRYDGGIAVGSHDPEMIEYAISLHEEYGTDFEMQMLMGVRSRAQFELAETYEVTQYVPYGPEWKRWFLNRLRNNAKFGARAGVEAITGNLLSRFV